MRTGPTSPEGKRRSSAEKPCQAGLLPLVLTRATLVLAARSCAGTTAEIEAHDQPKAVGFAHGERDPFQGHSGLMNSMRLDGRGAWPSW